MRYDKMRLSKKRQKLEKKKKKEGVRNQELKNKILEKFTSTVNTRFDQAEERISEFEDMSFEVTKSEEREWGKKGSEDILVDSWDTIEWSMCTLWKYQKEKKERKEQTASLNKQWQRTFQI